MRTLKDLLQVIEFADKYRVKNVRFHLGMDTVIGRDLQISTYKCLKEWAEKKGLNVKGAFYRNKNPNWLCGIALRTKQRNCSVRVYFY